MPNETVPSAAELRALASTHRDVSSYPGDINDRTATILDALASREPPAGEAVEPIADGWLAKRISAGDLKPPLRIAVCGTEYVLAPVAEPEGWRLAVAEIERFMNLPHPQEETAGLVRARNILRIKLHEQSAPHDGGADV